MNTFSTFWQTPRAAFGVTVSNLPAKHYNLVKIQAQVGGEEMERGHKRNSAILRIVLTFFSSPSHILLILLSLCSCLSLLKRLHLHGP